MESAKSRFLRYVTYYTTSDEFTGTSPSTERQKDLGRALMQELEALKLEDVHMDDCGNVLATLPASEGVDAPVAVSGEVPAAEAIPVTKIPTYDGTKPKFTKVEIICKESRFESLKRAMSALGITGMTVSHVLGCGVQGGRPEYYRGVPVETNLLPKVQVDIVVSKVPVRSVIDTAKKVLYTGHIGDGKIFVYDAENVVKVRTGEEGYDALQDVE